MCIDSNKTHEELYYKNEEKLKQILKKCLDSKELMTLNKKQIFELLDLCSSFRPIEPWQILLKFSMANDKLNKENK